MAKYTRNKQYQHRLGGPRCRKLDTGESESPEDKNSKLLSHISTPRKYQALASFNLPKRQSKGRPYTPSQQLPSCLQDHTMNYLNEKATEQELLGSSLWFKLSWKSTENSFHQVIIKYFSKHQVKFNHKA